MKKIVIITVLSVTLMMLTIFFYILQDSQNKFTLKIKSSISKESRYFIKNNINTYLNNFGIKLKFKSNSELISSKGKIYNINEYNNIFLDYQGPRSYLGLWNDKLFLVTGTGIITFTDIEDLIKNKSFKFNSINTNLKDIVKYDDFFLNSNFGIKGILIDKNSIYISLSNKLKDDCYNISILKSEINFENLKFSYLFNPNQCVNKINDYGEFQPIQSGGAMSEFDEHHFLLTTGEFRYRDHAQSDESIFGKVLLINKKTGNYNLISKGHRNSQGIYYDKKKGVILSTEHGPMGGDEINLNKNLFNKNNYGWPISSYGEHYPTMTPENAYQKAPLHKSHNKYGFIEPIKYFVPSIGITQILKVDNSFGYIDFQNYFFSSMGYEDRDNSLSIHQIVFDENYDSIIFEDKIKINHRVRDIIFIPQLKILVGYLEKRGSIITISYHEN